MKITEDRVKEFIKDYDFLELDEDCDFINVVINSNKIKITDDDYDFMHNEDDIKFSCATRFGIEMNSDNSFGFKTTYFDDISTFEEFVENVKNFAKFMELAKPFELKYKEHIKLQKVQKDF
jgi:hypothetical protein